MQEIEIESIEFTEEEVEMYDLQVEKNNNFILENDIVTHNSGKSFLLRTIMDRVTKLPLHSVKLEGGTTEMRGYSVFIPTDIKDEFKSSKYPAQSKFTKNIFPGEKPTGQKIIALRPTFFKKFDPHLAKDNHWISVDMSKMEELDFMTLLKVSRMSEAQQIMMQSLYNKIGKESNFTMSKLKTALDELDGYDDNQKIKMKAKLQPLFDSGFSDERYYRDLVKGINQGNIITINMEDYDRMGKGAFAFPEVFVGMTLRVLRIARRKGNIPPLFVFIDEAGRFIPKGENPPCKKDIIEGDKVDRRYNISYLYATQYFSDLPDEVKKTSRYIFLPYNIDKQVLADTLIFTGSVTNGFWQNAQNDAIRHIREMQRFQWLVIDTDAKEKRIIDLAGLLSAHSETEN